MITDMTRRVREVVGISLRPCAHCGKSDVVLVRSVTQGNLLERLLNRVDPDERTTATCRSCGARVPMSAGPRSSTPRAHAS